MRKKVGVLICGVLLLGACSSANNETTNVDSRPENTVTTTTVQTSLNPPSGETEVTCDARALSASYGERVKPEKCTSTWAIGDTDRDTWQCGKGGCPQTRIYHYTNNKWINTATCDRRIPLTRFASSCYVPDVGLATADLVPPQDVACIVWAANALPRYVKETGCPLSRDAVLDSLKETCPETFDITQIPIEKCDRGEVVKQLQTRLRELNFNVSASGFYGPDSARAVFTFQEGKGLLATAIVDEETWKALGLAP